MFTLLTKENYHSSIEQTENGILIFFKKLCPHCINMEKCLDKFKAMEENASLFRMDIEEFPEIAKELGAERPPTLLVIKNGNVTSVKAGLMNPRDLRSWYLAS